MNGEKIREWESKINEFLGVTNLVRVRNTDDLLDFLLKQVLKGKDEKPAIKRKRRTRKEIEEESANNDK